jgi:hypothetical protein
MGGLGKSTVALAAAQAARAAGWRVWWVNASDPASLTGGMLEVFGQLGAPESVLRPVREGSPTAADRAWEFLNGSHRAGQKWLLVLDNADHPAVLAAHGSAGPADHAGWVRPTPNGAVIVTTRVDRRRVLGDDHPDTFTDYFRLAAVIEQQGRTQEARELYDQVFTGRRRTLGEQHPDTVAAYRAIDNLNHAHNQETL